VERSEAEHRYGEAVTNHAETLERYFATYDESGRAEVEKMATGLFHPEVEFSPFLAREVDSRIYRGLEEVLGFFDELDATLDDVRYENREYRPVSDDVVVMLTRLTGTARGSTVPIAQELGLVYEFEDGLARRITAFGSHEEALKAGEERSHAEA